MADVLKSCENCANVDKFLSNGEEIWCCEEYGFFHGGVPVNCAPPHDEACEHWTDDPKQANTWERYV